MAVLLKIFQALSLFDWGEDAEKRIQEVLEDPAKIPFLTSVMSDSNIWETNCFFHQISSSLGSVDISEAMVLPISLRILEEDAGTGASKGEIKIPRAIATLAVQSLGRIEPYFNSYLIIETLRAICELKEVNFDEWIKKFPTLMLYVNFAKDLGKVQESLEENMFTKKKYHKYVNLFADKKKKKSNLFGELQRYLFYTHISQNASSLHYLEKILIQLLGHVEIDSRDQATVLLNMLYDGVDWQIKEAFVPIITYVGCPFILDERIIFHKPLKEAVIMLSCPSYLPDCPITVTTWHKVDVKKSSKPNEYIITKRFEDFCRCGFFDWKIVTIDEEGKIEMLKKSHSNDDQIFSQGRFIVQPADTTKQQIHEVMVDYKDKDTDPDKNFLSIAKDLPEYHRQGITSLYLLGVLERDNGISYEESTGLMSGALRPNASPLAITDRACPNRMLGGEKGYTVLAEEAKKNKIKLFIDCLSRISSSRSNRKYRKTLLHSLDEDGKFVMCYGTDGRSIKYEDTALLNYRKLRSWNLLIDDLKSFARKHRVDGVHLDNGQAWPQILELDIEEMYRQDTDGKPAYTSKDILNGEVVIKNENFGYWSTSKMETYANPLFVKLCRKMWEEFPQFYLVGECWGGSNFENRQGILASSGIIPRLFKLPVAIASLFGKHLQKDGKVTQCHPQTVKAIQNWYEKNRMFLPKGASIIQSSSSHTWPYPAHLYGRGVWSAVDLLFFMPDIPMTFMGEIFGHVVRRNTTNLYQARAPQKQTLQRAKSQLRIAMEERDPSDEETDVNPTNPSQAIPEQPKKIVRVRSSNLISVVSNDKEAKQKEDQIVKEIGSQSGFDIGKIHIHYEHRRKLREKKDVLRCGELVTLEARHSEGIHSHVLAFARFSEAETAIIAINFTSNPVSFLIDFSNLLPFYKKANCHSNSVTLISDWVGKEEEEYCFLMEFIKSKMPVTLPPYGCFCKGIQICRDDLMVYAHSMQNSLLKLHTRIITGKDCSSKQACIQLLSAMEEKKPVNDIVMLISNIFKNYLLPNSISMYTLFNRLHILRDNPEIGGKFMAYCKKIYSYKEKLPTMLSATQAVSEIVESNRLGPIVFMAPELGRWSTVGGLGVMVDELSQGLAQLGEDVYMITPYYHTNRKGETWYLEKDPAKFVHDKNIAVKASGGEYTVGVHKGTVSGVKLIFLHHADLFPKVYSSENASQMLRQIVAFAKSCMQFLCDEKLIPSVVITNDWYTGLVAAYRNCGAFGTTFNSTTFLHIFHNLQESYEGRIYPNPSEGSLDHIHELPRDWLVDPLWGKIIINPSRCAAICSDQWATVSNSYKNDLLTTSALAPILKLKSKPFGFPNGIPIEARIKRLRELAGPDHETAKRKLQQKYFGYSDLDNSVPVFSFVGRIVHQKGVHLIVETAEEIINKYHGKINILVGGPADRKDPYAAKCAGVMDYLRKKYPSSFYAAPDEFFTDGPTVNLGSDFGVMPSLFEPGGIVQHEFFVAGTPVVAFKTGGLKDSVFEFKWDTNTGNGFVFESYTHGDYKYAIERAIGTFKSKEKTRIIRENSKDSCMDGATVSRAWQKECYRLKEKVWIDYEIMNNFLDTLKDEWDFKKFNDSYIDEYVFRTMMPSSKLSKEEQVIPLKELMERTTKDTIKTVTFRLSLGSKIANKVELCGSFDDWKMRYQMNYDKISNCWFLTMHLSKGKYFYKYVVDDTWICNQKESISKDPAGNLNNITLVE